MFFSCIYRSKVMCYTPGMDAGVFEFRNIGVIQMYTTSQATTPATIGERIKYLRMKRGMSQKSLAVQLNIGGTSICRWEAGDFPTMDHLCRIASIFGVSLDYLVYGVSKDDENCADLTGLKLQQIRLIKALVAELKQS